MKQLCLAFGLSFALAACSAADTETSAEAPEDTYSETAQQMPDPTDPTTVTSDRYPSPPEPHFGPEPGSITFQDTDPGPTIGGVLTMRPAAAENAAGITQYMIHWGLEVGAPGTEDDAGNGDLGGDCKGFRDPYHIVMMMAADAGEEMRWEIPAGTEVPDGAVYFVGHSLYGKIHNLAKCTQIPIENWIEG